MIWLYLLLAIVAFVGAFKTTSVALAIVCLLAALGFIVAWVLGLLAQRIGSQSRDDSQILDPQELRRLREQADARRVAASTSTPSDPPPAL